MWSCDANTELNEQCGKPAAVRTLEKSPGTGPNPLQTELQRKFHKKKQKPLRI